MAKRQNEQPGQRPAKVRYFELEASDDTIQRALSTFERMQNPGEAVQRVVKRLPAAGAPAEATLFDARGDGQDVIDAEVADADQEASEPESPNQRRKRGELPPVDRNAGIAVAGNIDFYPQGKTSLKDFFAAKAPKSDMEACLVFCYYLQEELALPQFGAGHVLAGFNEVNKPIPADLPSTLRNMREGKKRSKAWLSFNELDNIRVITNGLNHVRHKMGKKSTPEDNGAK